MKQPAAATASAPERDAATWQAGGLSVCGASHRSANRPNEDAFGYRHVHGRPDSLVVAVSDGHGAAVHEHAAIGARLAVASALTAMEDHMSAPQGLPEIATLSSTIVQRWRLSVDRYCAEQNIALVEGPQRYVPFGATLVCAAVDAHRLVTLQIGDGDLFTAYSDGSLRRPMRDDLRWQKHRTFSLCLEDAPRLARGYAAVRHPGDAWPNFLFLSTDGIANSYLRRGDFLAIVQSYRSLAKEGIATALSGADCWLEDVTTCGSGDDVTMCVAVRGPAAF